MKNAFCLQAREALKKYLHYYERWENHARSLKLEEQTLANLKRRINQKVVKEIKFSNPTFQNCFMLILNWIFF